MGKWTGPDTERGVSDFIGGLVFGLLIVVAGVAVMGDAFPSTDTFGDASGSMGGVFAGLALTAVGSTVLSIYTIAMGVYLGTRGAQERRHAPAATYFPAKPAEGL